MAASLRPSAIRQIGRSVPLRRLISTQLTDRAATSCSRTAGSFLRPSKATQHRLSKSSTSSLGQIAAFHASSKKAILPAKPQRLHGTANDPTPIYDPSPTHGSYHWTFERLIAAGLVPLTIAPFAAGSLNPTTDAILCATLLIHSHVGFESIIIDYLPIKRVPKTRALFWWGLRAATVVVGVGLYEFETNDVGLTEAIKRVWTA